MLSGAIRNFSTLLGLLGLLGFLASTPASSEPGGLLDWHEVPSLGEPFAQAGVSGTFVLFDPAADRFTGWNRDRAVTRFVPASTFKVPNSLIGLSVGAVRDVDEKLPYHSEDPPFTEAWVRDMGLREAIALSNVPIYQELARRIGHDRMQRALQQLSYGSQEIGPRVDRFWLDGPLTLSAVEQARFLARLALGTLPFPEAHQRSVREITLLEAHPTWSLHAKTGWQNAPGAGVGWWVGWVERGATVHAFALNLDIRTPAEAKWRQEIGRACLRRLGLLD